MSGEYDTYGEDNTEPGGITDTSGGNSDFGKTADLWSGVDQSGLQGEFHLPDVSSPSPVSTASSGVDFETPRADNSGQYPIIPVKTPFGTPKSDYNYWDPGAALDTLSAWGRTLPGVNDLGQRFADIGTNIGNSDFGRTISTSPLASAGSWMGDQITSALRGGIQTVSDAFSSPMDHVAALQKGDVGGFLLNLLRGPEVADAAAKGDYLKAVQELQSGMLTFTNPIARGVQAQTNDRIDGALHGDQDMQKQLTDELAFLSLVVPVAKGPALLGKIPFVADALENVGTNALAKETMHWATRAIAAGYGAEIGGDIASGIDPRTQELNKIISEQRLVPDSSPLRGIYDFTANGLVDPIPLLGKFSSFGPIRRAMDDAGGLRLPWQGELKMAGELSEPELANMKSEMIMNLAERRVEARLDAQGDGPRVVSDAAVRDEANYLTSVLRGEAGSPSEYTRTLQGVNGIYDYAERDMKNARFNDHEPTPKELAENRRQWDTTRNLIQTAEEQVAGHALPNGPESHLAVRNTVQTTLDYDRATSDVQAIPGALNKSLPAAALDQLKQDHPGVFEDIEFRQKGKILEELAARKHFAPSEPTSTPTIEPPISNGTTRLYRGERNTVHSYRPASGGTGNFYTKDIEEAKHYGGGTNAHLYHVDVPTADLPKYGSIQASPRTGEQFYELPNEVTATRKSLSTSSPMADAAAQVRAMGQFKVITKGGNYVALDLGGTIPRGHPMWREASRIAGGSNKLNDLLHDVGADRKTATLQQVVDVLAKDNPGGASTLERFTRSGRGYYTEKSAAGDATVVRPVLWADPTIAAQLHGSSTQLGRFVAGFRQYLPSAQLGRDMYDSQFAAWNKATGATRGEFERLWDAFGQTAKDKGLTHMEQIQGNPPNVSTELNSIAQRVLGSKADGINAAQVLAQGMPRDGLRQMIGQMTGQSVGKVGVGPSVFTSLRANLPGQAGDFWRWMANTGHPLVRYSLSPVWNGFVKLESHVFNWMNGAAFAPRDGILRDTVNAYMKPLMERYAGKGAGLGHEAVSSEAMASEATSGKAFGDKRQALIARRMEFMADQATNELPKEFANQMKQQMPRVWDDVRKTAGSDAAATEQFLTDQKVRRDFMSGNMSSEDMMKYAGLTSSEQLSLYMPLARRLEDSLQKVYLDAQTTHISNPMRSYWERSLNHPALVYPLSWSMKALGEWTKFLTHSAFGLPTHMAGLATYNDVMDATQKAIANDPDTQRFMNQHPETLKVLAYLMPGTPMTGVGMGVGGNVKTFINVGKAISQGKNPVDQVNWGVARDANALSKAWSEWVLNKPKTKLSRPGI